MTRLKKEKKYRLGDRLNDGRRIIRLIPLRYLGIGRHQILTDGDYTKSDYLYLDREFNADNIMRRYYD